MKDYVKIEPKTIAESDKDITVQPLTTEPKEKNVTATSVGSEDKMPTDRSRKVETPLEEKPEVTAATEKEETKPTKVEVKKEAKVEVEPKNVFSLSTFFLRKPLDDVETVALTQEDEFKAELKEENESLGKRGALLGMKNEYILMEHRSKIMGWWRTRKKLYLFEVLGECRQVRNWRETLIAIAF